MIIQLDSAGKIIGHSKMKYTQTRLGPQKTYAPDKAIVVKNECVDFRIRMISFIAEPYRYVYRRGQISVHYDVRGYVKKKRLGARGYLVTDSHKKSFFRFYTILALLSLVMLFAVCALVKYFIDSDDFNFKDSAAYGINREGGAIYSDDGAIFTFVENV